MQLQRMAAMTGGRRFFPTSVKELDKIYEKIERDDRRALQPRLHLDRRRA